MRIDFLPDEFADVAGAANVDLAGGEEGGHADVDQQAAFDLSRHLAADVVAFLLGLADPLPPANAVGLALGEHDQPAVGFDLFQQDFHFQPDDDFGGVVELMQVHGAFALEADLDDSLVAGDADDVAFENRADLVAGSFRHEVVERILGERLPQHTG